MGMPVERKDISLPWPDPLEGAAARPFIFRLGVGLTYLVVRGRRDGHLVFGLERVIIIIVITDVMIIDMGPGVCRARSSRAGTRALLACGASLLSRLCKRNAAHLFLAKQPIPPTPPPPFPLLLTP
jgi:hypothetical protein